ncbi:phosphoglycerate dehydrogenase [Variovorax paradoxus]|uniref:phosphoglycerate dehydrogenase n=1 Tax=Variovorax paradoxus TaxID=34073 RepID=UPI0019345CD5|nr:phosphoglycerate dehydrogenase [Variovorax paradoxus]
MSTLFSARRVVVTQRFFDAQARAFLEQHGCTVSELELPAGVADGDLGVDVLRRHLEGAQGWIVGHARVDDELLRALPALRVIARRGVGHDRVDQDAVRRHGKVATIAAGGNDAAVADHAIALMLAVGRRLHEARAQLVAGDWSIPLATELYRKTVGVVGLGRIGRGVVRRLRGFEARVLIATPERDEAFVAEQGARFASLDELLACADIVSLHAPLTSATHSLIDAAALTRMKRGAILVNTARGGLVDDAALLAALEEGRLGGAGLDVFESEADPGLQAVTHALLRLPQVVATPHAGASTAESLARTNLIAARCVVQVLDGQTPAAECLLADGRSPNLSR